MVYHHSNLCICTSLLWDLKDKFFESQMILYPDDTNTTSTKFSLALSCSSRTSVFLKQTIKAMQHELGCRSAMVKSLQFRIYMKLGCKCSALFLHFCKFCCLLLSSGFHLQALAIALKQVATPEHKAYMQQVKRNAQALAFALTRRKCRSVPGGTDNHLVLWDLRNLGLTVSVVDGSGLKVPLPGSVPDVVTNFSNKLHTRQRCIAEITQMIHVSSLKHLYFYLHIIG
ncbi:hypothetical protein MKX01_012639 [Papaver californicum]|nr:hypothetical protein MKX01_012639 [Papaver californicum]